MDSYKNNPDLFEEKADIIKGLAHPVRLCITKNLIEKGSSNVTEMQNCLEAPQSTISQHLSKLKAAGIIKGKRNGQEIIYSISDTKIKKIIEELFS